MVIGRMISCSFCWAIMKKMTKKWDLETSNAKTEPKIGIYVKNWPRQVLLRNFDFGQSQRSIVKVNSSVNDSGCQSQRSGQIQQLRMLTWDDVIVWCHPRADVAVREMEQAHGARGKRVKSLFLVREAHVRDRRHVGASACEAETLDSAWRRVWGSFWQIFVGFSLGSEDLSIYALTLTVWSTKLTKSECFRGCGRDGGDSLLTMTFGWRRG